MTIRPIEDETELAELEPWDILGQPRERWPTSPGRTFVPAAVTDIAGRTSAAPGSRQGADGAGDARRRPTFEEQAKSVAARLATLLRDQSVASFGRPVGGRGPVRLTRDHWDHDHALAAVATGAMNLAGPDGKTVRHWLFVDDRDVELMAKVTEIIERPDSGVVGPAYELRFRMEELSELLLSGVSALASAPDPAPQAPCPPPAAQGQAATLAAMLSDARLSMRPEHRDAVKAFGVNWLRERFANERGRQLFKQDYRERALVEFGEAVAGKLFDQIWADAATGEHAWRRRPGRRPAQSLT